MARGPLKTRDLGFAYRPLTDNFRANMYFMGIGAVVVMTLWFTWGFYFKRFDRQEILGLFLGYFLASYWFSPDLDHIENRPGKHSFPIKFAIKFLASFMRSGGRAARVVGALPMVICEAIHQIGNTIWRMMWQPFAMMVTHRGVIHWPVIGTLMKWYYVGLVANGFLKLVWILPGGEMMGVWLRSLRSIQVFLPLSPGDFLMSRHSLFGGLFLDGFYGPTAFFAAGLLAADITHILVDAWDSRGRSFLPPAHIAPRGLIVKVLTGIRRPF